MKQKSCFYKTENKNPKTSSIKFYYHAKDKRRDYLFTEAQLIIAAQRASLNPEDIPDDLFVDNDYYNDTLKQQRCSSFVCGVLSGILLTIITLLVIIEFESIYTQMPYWLRYMLDIF